jgi:nucleoid-associated protein Lsr2
MGPIAQGILGSFRHIWKPLVVTSGIEQRDRSHEGIPAVSRRIVTELVDDIDGSPATETVLFALDGVAYEIDLTKRNAAGLRNAFAKYVGAARRTRGSHPRATRSRVTSDSRTIREWAKANKVPVPDRGRIPASVVAQFNTANRR